MSGVGENVVCWRCAELALTTLGALFRDIRGTDETNVSSGATSRLYERRESPECW